MDFCSLRSFFTLLLVMKTTFYGYRADITGLFWLAAGLFLALSLSSYHPTDPSLNSIGFSPPVQNKCGYLGSFLSDILYQSCGWGAWLFIWFAVKSSMQAFRRKYYLHQVGKELLLFLISVTTVSALFELHQPIHYSPFPDHISPGGLLGNAVVQGLGPYLNFAGLILLLWPLSFILLTIHTKSSMSLLFMRTVKMTGELGFYLGTSWRRKMTRIIQQIYNNTIHSIKSLLTKSKQSSVKLPVLKKRRFSYSLSSEEEDNSSSTFNELLGETLWQLPSPNLLSSSTTGSKVNEKEIALSAERLKKKLQQFSISGEITDIHSGPVISLFEFKPEDHVKVARIAQMEDDLMMALKTQSIRIIAPIPGKDVVGIETAHNYRQFVYLKGLIDEPAFWQEQKHLPLILGRHVDGRAGIVDLRQIPHLMVAGSTGSGKSVFIISFLLSLLFRHTPKTLKLLLVDPKRVDLSAFESLPHLLSAPIRDSKIALSALHWCLGEMDKRYRSLARFHVRDIEEFNRCAEEMTDEERQRHQECTDSLDKKADYYFSPQPYICIVLEEFGDLMSSTERNQIERSVVRLAQMARACGMHLILSMQSPRKDVVTGLIKTNIPGRISFKVSSRVDSRIILDEGGAERLLTKGDMLYLGPGQARAERYHGPFVKEKEIAAVIKFWKKQDKKFSYPLSFSKKESSMSSFSSSLDPEDETYKKIFAYVSELKEISASHLQRKYGLGYPRAARLIDRLEEEGIVGPARGSKPREVLAHK